jgi:hypothetical protein
MPFARVMVASGDIMSRGGALWRTAAPHVSLAGIWLSFRALLKTKDGIGFAS